MSRRYRRSPIVEALCEFRLESAAPWDATIPDRVYEQVKKSFPLRRTSRTVRTTTDRTQDEKQQKVDIVELTQMLRGDEKAMIQVGDGLLAVNRLAPYESWNEFFPLIRQGFQALSGQLEVKGIARIGLRYINRITIPSDKVRLEDYFSFHPAAPAELAAEVGGFICGVQVAKPDLQSLLRVQLASRAEEEANGLSVLLDLDHFTAEPCAPRLESVCDWVERAHDELEKAFEACILDPLREIFEVER